MEVKINGDFLGEKKINKPFFDNKILIYNKLQNGFSPEIVSFKPGMLHGFIMKLL